MRAASALDEAAEPEAVPVDAEPHQVAASNRQVAVEDALLRDIADALPPLGRRAALDLDPAGRRLQQPEHDPDQRGLAGAVRPEHGQQLAGLELEAEPFPEEALAEGEPQVDGRDDRRDRVSHGHARRRE